MPGRGKNGSEMSAMFSTSRSSQGGSSSGNLVEFKAGRSFLQPASAPNKKKVVADKTKGLVFIKQSNDQLMHFCWKNRETGAIVDDLIIFPGDTEFKEVKGCPDGKVYMLKFKTSDERRLFWIQDGNTDADKDLCQKVNDALNKPPTTRASARGGSSERTTGGLSTANLAGLGASEELGALGGLDQQQLMQLLQFMNQGSSDSPSLVPQIPTGNNAERGTSSGAPKVSASELTQLQTLLGGLRAPGTTGADSSQGNSERQVAVELGDIVAGGQVVETAKNNADRLLSHMPAEDKGSSDTKKALEDTVRSPHYRQAANTFGHALSTGQMAPVLERFGISEGAAQAAATGNLLEFAKKLTEAERGLEAAQAGAESTAGASTEAPAEGESEEVVKEPKPKRGKTEEDEMDLD
ncbi:adhesion regulating molecule region [Ancylostoma caninum]|uniref:Proteasomal ubiquitin receptor ADRM1 homolog n=1 Tax=Ancylostoma caninum TaxID=29170 RepID=A0A368GUX6_ANCCA|nr:adhesion regulating molecule region [Ancylostoma caninum]